MSGAPAVDVQEVAFGRRPCVLRLPFRFGGVTLERADALVCRVTARGPDGAVARGWSADLLAPRWFRKDTDATPAQDADELAAGGLDTDVDCDQILDYLDDNHDDGPCIDKGGDDGGNDVPVETGNCDGCASTGRPGTAVWGMLGALLLVLRRRRRNAA